jgi:hypothetical protein
VSNPQPFFTSFTDSDGTVYQVAFDLHEDRLVDIVRRAIKSKYKKAQDANGGLTCRILTITPMEVVK